MCVFSVASGLFVFPAIEIYYTPALRVYNYERADGVGRSHDLVLQGFARYISIAFVPVILSSGLIYLLVSPSFPSLPPSLTHSLISLPPSSILPPSLIPPSLPPSSFPPSLLPSLPPSLSHSLTHLPPSLIPPSLPPSSFPPSLLPSLPPLPPSLIPISPPSLPPSSLPPSLSS